MQSYYLLLVIFLLFFNSEVIEENLAEHWYMFGSDVDFKMLLK